MTNETLEKAKEMHNLILILKSNINDWERATRIVEIKCAMSSKYAISIDKDCVPFDLIKTLALVNLKKQLADAEETLNSL